MGKVNNRLASLRQRMEEKELEAVLISQAENRRYLSSFTGSTGFLVVSSTRAVLATDFRYVEQAKGQAADFEIVQIKGELFEWLPDLASSQGIKKVGVEAGDLSFAIYRRLVEGVPETPLQIVPTEGLVESLRVVKDEEELTYLAKAAALADAAFEYAVSLIRPGMKEKEISWEIEKFLRERDSEGLPFDIIVASGSNSALPHAHPTERLIGPGEPIIIDLGARIEGYCSDLTRTLCLGTTDDMFRQIYDLTLGAQLTAIATIQAGMSGEQADCLSRTVIEQGGQGNAFGHGLGHGVGLAVHEDPRLGTNSSYHLRKGMVFTIEPGIYISGWGGVRIEDTVVMEGKGVKVLTRASKVSHIS